MYCFNGQSRAHLYDCSTCGCSDQVPAAGHISASSTTCMFLLGSHVQSEQWPAVAWEAVWCGQNKRLPNGCSSLAIYGFLPRSGLVLNAMLAVLLQ